MKRRLLKPILLTSLLGIAACSQQVETAPEPVVKPYVTNAEYVLEAIAKNKTSAVAFQVKPIRSSACEYMYLELGQKNAEEQWEVTNAVFPGKNALDNFGQDKLEDQIHFAEVDGVGEFGVIALGCKPYGRDMRAFRGLFGTFQVDYGRVNYIGEITLIPQGKDYSTVEMSDRSIFAKAQIETQLPELGEFFQENFAEKYVPKLSKQQQAALDGMAARAKELQPILDIRNKVANELTAANRDWSNWRAEYGYTSDEIPKEVKFEYKKIVSRRAALQSKLELYDKFIDEGRSLSYVKRYSRLLNDYEQKRDKYHAEIGDKFPSFKDKPSEKAIELMWEMTQAQDDLRTFKENNP